MSKQSKPNGKAIKPQKQRAYRKTELFDEGATSFEQMAKITERKGDDLVCDVFKTFLWILHQQTFGAKIVSQKGRKYREPLSNLVKDKEAAKKYFDELGW